MLQIRLGSIKCNEDTNESGDDRPYVLVTTVAVPPPQPGSPLFFAGPSDVTLYSFGKMNADSRAAFGSAGHRFQSFWGVGALPATLADTQNGIVIVALMENDENDPSLVRSFVLAAVQTSLVRSISLPRGGKVTMLLSDVDSARRLPTGIGGAFNSDDPIGAPQELRFTLDELQRTEAGETVVKTLHFVGDGARYSLSFEAFNPALEGLPPPPVLFPTTTPTRQMGAMEAFRSRQAAATNLGFVGGFPNFYSYPGAGSVGFVGGTIFLTQAAAEWRDVPLSDLDNVDLNNFEERMRKTNVYANRNGFVGGFPNYFHAEYHDGRGIVCGTILLKQEASTWEDVYTEDLGNPALDDYESRFKGTQDYAGGHGFLGGFPNLFHAEERTFDVVNGRPVNRTVCGTVLIRSNYINFQTGRRERAAELRNV
jgi:hypothetical protein